MGANCSASCALTCYVCINKCKVDEIRNRFSFLPPTPPSYTIVKRPNPKEDDHDHGATAGSGKNQLQRYYLFYTIRELKTHIVYRQAQEKVAVYLLRNTVTDKKTTLVSLFRRKGNFYGITSSSRRRGSGGVVRDQHDDTEQAGNHEVDRNRNFVLLHCHGNATDMGLMLPVYYDLSETLQIDVLGVEYSGYGPIALEKAKDGAATTATQLAAEAGQFTAVLDQGSGAAAAPPSGEKKMIPREAQQLKNNKPIVPHFRHVTGDADAAYKFLTEELHYDPQNIILYGQSVGTGPIVELAAKIKSQCGGVILHSAMLSGIRVLDPNPEGCCKPSTTFVCFDLFKNAEKIRQLTCPVLLIHGRQDTVVPFAHSQKLFTSIEESRRYPPYFPLEAGHNDVVETNPVAYFQVLAAFFERVATSSTGASSQSSLFQEHLNGLGGGGLGGQRDTQQLLIMSTLGEDFSSARPAEVFPATSAGLPQQEPPPQQIMTSTTLFGKQQHDLVLPFSGGESEVELQAVKTTASSSTTVLVGPADNRYGDIRSGGMKNAVAGLQKI
ncbi:unnamed protein product [Amoebophrya sp. A120]|nr:unnamed protein product [Amoebophrya sp. A120]|eukprot:GSA120T00008915001.1